MANDKKTKKSFGGIFGGLGKMLLKEEFRNTETEIDEQENTSSSQSQPSAQTVEVKAPISTTTQPVQTVGVSNIDDVVKKIYAALKKINMPGIDFMEMWDAAEALGGITPQHLQSAYTALNIAAGGKLLVADLTSSGNYYKTELHRLMEEDITTNQGNRQRIVTQQNAEKSSLTEEVNTLTGKIAEMQHVLLEKQKLLATVDSKYEPQINEIDHKVSAGKTALLKVTEVIDKVLQHVQEIKTS